MRDGTRLTTLLRHRRSHCWQGMNPLLSAALTSATLTAVGDLVAQACCLAVLPFLLATVAVKNRLQCTVPSLSAFLAPITVPTCFLPAADLRAAQVEHQDLRPGQDRSHGRFRAPLLRSRAALLASERASAHAHHVEPNPCRAAYTCRHRCLDRRSERRRTQPGRVTEERKLRLSPPRQPTSGMGS